MIVIDDNLPPVVPAGTDPNLEGAQTALEIKDRQIEEFKNQIIGLETQKALLEKEVTDLQIKLSTAQSLLEAQNLKTKANHPLETELVDEEEAIRRAIETALKKEEK